MKVGYSILSMLLLVLLSCSDSCVKKAASTTATTSTDSSSSISQTPTSTKSKDSIVISTKMNDLIGVDGFHEDNVNDMKAVNFIRAYCNWDWFEGDNPGDQMIFQNSRGGWYFDDAFAKIKTAGIKISICFQGAIKNLQGTGNFKFNDKPIDAQGLSTTDPNSYKAISNALFQIAARYGKTKLNVNKLNVKSDQIVSGLDLVDYIEVWNEPDKGWLGADAQFSPEEYAAMLSICYDKIKEADPTMKVTMGGLASLSIDYVKKMKAWFEANRQDKRFAADVVNMHIYAFNNKIVWGKTWPLIGPAETPEDAKFRDKTLELVNYCKQNIPGSEVWISEFGWDTNNESVLCPIPIEGLTIHEVQARWIIRAYMEFASAGIDKAQLFALYDPSQNYISTQFGTCGLLDRTQNFTKKTSWYYTYTLKNQLYNMGYIGEQKMADNNVKVYKFKNVNSDNGAYVVWLNSSNNNIKSNCIIPIYEKATEANAVELTDGSITGTKLALNLNNNSVSLTVSEKPLIILVNNIR